MTAIVFASACLLQASSNSTSVLESNSSVYQQYELASETEDDTEDTCPWYDRCRVPGGGSMSEYSKKDEV